MLSRAQRDDFFLHYLCEPPKSGLLIAHYLHEPPRPELLPLRASPEIEIKPRQEANPLSNPCSKNRFFVASKATPLECPPITTLSFAPDTATLTSPAAVGGLAYPSYTTIVSLPQGSCMLGRRAQLDGFSCTLPL